MLKINAFKYTGSAGTSANTIYVKYFFSDSPAEEVEMFCSSLQPYIKSEEVTKLSAKGGSLQRKVYGIKVFDEVLITVIKKSKTFDRDYFRNGICGLVGGTEKNEVQNIIIEPSPFASVKDTFDREEDYLNSIIEGALYAGYKFDKYKSADKEVKEVNVYISYENAAIEKLISSRERLMTAVRFVRDLENEPANVVFPASLAAMIMSTFEGTGINITVYDEKKIEEEKMGGLTAVGKGSVNPPRFIIMEYKGRSADDTDLALVGKGITFDTGGISLKPAADMWLMKADMSGAAVTAGIIYAAALNKLPVNITGVIAAAENMPSGNALKPGDIVTTSSGKTIEVDNTDAEGRIVLADALHYVSKLKPGHIIDFATLTGACVVALGEFTAGLFSNDDSLALGLLHSSSVTHERLWRMPMWEDYNKQIESEVADVKNLGGRWGGAITAAKFLEKWVDEDIPWAHLDIAGPSMPNKLKNYTSVYMTGFGVRLVYDFIDREFALKNKQQ
ncbi:MAG: leucyl aminopeptidase [Ignavibacteriaceae bacterium]|nr:leucyl aminopeptidase [Ignavibacteriaceae bacterium]